jgi:hypothetical protein
MADEIGSELRQPFVLALRVAGFDSEVLALDVAAFGQNFAEQGDRIRNRAWGTGI